MVTEDYSNGTFAGERDQMDEGIFGPRDHEGFSSAVRLLKLLTTLENLNFLRDR